MQRPKLATAVLAAVWLVYGVLLWVLFAVGPTVIPRSYYLPGILLTVAFVGALVASRRWPAVWRRTFLPTVGVPGWLWLGGLLTVGVVGVASLRWPLSLEALVWTAVLCVACSYAGVALSDRPLLRDGAPWPGWIAAVVLASGVAVVGALADGVANLLTVVFLFALVLFTFYVLFVLPLTLYQSLRDPEHRSPSSYPSVSVLIPAYDEEGYVGDCIESVLASTYPDERLEVVVVDDGSTDGTYDEAAAYRDDGVTVLHRENGGKHAALNFGLACSTGSVVVTVDADSRPEPTAIERMVARLQEDPALGALSAPVLATNDDRALTALQRIEYAISNVNRRAYSIFEAVPVVPGCLGVYRREALEDVWGYDPDTVTEDFDLTVKLLKNGWTVRHGTGLVWTVVPDDWSSLWRQRLRWYRGSLETIRKHWDVLLTPQYGYLHALSLPVRVVAHLFGPLASFVILGAVVWGLVVGPTTYLLAILALFLVLTLLVTLFGLLLEDEPLRTLVYAPLLFVGYKHFVDLTIGVGTVRAFVADQRW